MIDILHGKDITILTNQSKANNREIIILVLGKVKFNRKR